MTDYGIDDFEPGYDFSKPRYREPLTRPPADETNEAETKYLDPVLVAVEMLQHLLPEFSTRIHGATQSVRIDGALPIGMRVSADPRMFPVSMPFGNESSLGRAVREVTEDPAARDARLIKRRLYIESQVYRSVEQIVGEIQAYAIKAVSLEPVILNREQAAFERGKAAGWLDGKDAGARQARAELLADAQEARERIENAQIILAGGDPNA